MFLQKSVFLRHYSIICYLACFANVADLVDNAMLTSAVQTNYLAGDSLTYACELGFASRVTPVVCACNDANPSNWVWDCTSAASPCERSEICLSLQ